MPIDSSRLSARVRDVLKGHSGPGARPDHARPLDDADVGEHPLREVRFVPDEDVPVSVERAEGCVVIEREYPAHVSHGRASVGDYAAAVNDHVQALALLAAEPPPDAAERRTPRAGTFEWDTRRRARDSRRRPGAPTSGPLLFFDLETTGLSGGVGTVAFLVGCGFFDGDQFRTRQFFLSGYEAEHDLLQSLATLTRGFEGLVSFNGRTFDVPLIEMRYAFHRLPSPFDDLPHFDMLHPARRLWRRRGGALADDGWELTAPDSDSESCALKSLEEAILRTGRVGDVPGFEIPSRYFQYLRTGDLDPLQAVFEHNRLDLLSLAALTGLAAKMAAGGPEAVPSAHESLAMGQLYECAGRDDQAEACFVQAAGLPGSPWDPQCLDGDIRVDALRKLALMRRRQRRFSDAADAWEAVLTIASRAAHLQEARQALAIHHEHRTRDLASARRLAESAAAAERDPARAAALSHRLGRLRRKQGE
jgi:uncharacterized protein YprB with RNaseH-like and TPR domain